MIKETVKVNCKNYGKHLKEAGPYSSIRFMIYVDEANKYGWQEIESGWLCSVCVKEEQIG